MRSRRQRKVSTPGHPIAGYPNWKKHSIRIALPLSCERAHDIEQFNCPSDEDLGGNPDNNNKGENEKPPRKKVGPGRLATVSPAALSAGGERNLRHVGKTRMTAPGAVPHDKQKTAVRRAGSGKSPRW